ncbi:MAG TPA: UbiD family decarboxylase, partial [Bacteroidales bacterium]|nr:UbiD family decarboxylase [Bacteroidales bacterium]
APLPDNVDEYLLAGFIRKKNVELVKCLTCNIEVPADVDFVIEGYIDPNEELIEEGPFGDHTGFYSLKEKYPIFHITCITHKRKAIYPTTIVGIPVKEDAFFAKATERIFLPLIKNIAPEIIDINMPPEGVFHNICIVKIKKHYPAQAIKVMNALWGVGQMMFNKYLIVIDQNTNINNYYEILKYISKNTVLPNNCIIVPGPLDILDHAVENIGIGSKMGIDATIKLESEEQQLLINNIPNTADNETIMNEFPDIININNLSQKIKLPILIMCVKKLSHIDLKKLHYKIINSGLVNGIKFILYIDKTVDANNLPMVTWIASSNTIPARDIFFDMQSNNNNTVMGINATIKTFEHDKYSRKWPNIIVSDKQTIDKIDKIWDKLNIGSFIESPSKMYENIVLSKGAIIK